MNTARYRARFARGEQVYKVALGPEVIEALIRCRWVERELADDREAVERAVEAGLIDAETAALLLFAAASSRAETLDQLYEKAKLDKALFYSGGPTAPHENRAKEFMQKYPGIAPHPNAAKLYLTWFLAGEQQSHLGSFSSRVDVANNYREFMTNNKLVADLRKRFEGYTGPPTRAG